MNITEKLVAAGLVNREFDLIEGAKALGLSDVEAAIAFGSELALNDSFTLVFRVNENEYDDLLDIPNDVNVGDVKAFYHLYVEPESIARVREVGNRIIRWIISATIIICGTIMAAFWIVCNLK